MDTAESIKKEMNYILSQEVWLYLHPPRNAGKVLISMGFDLDSSESTISRQTLEKFNWGASPIPRIGERTWLAVVPSEQGSKRLFINFRVVDVPQLLVVVGTVDSRMIREKWSDTLRVDLLMFEKLRQGPLYTVPSITKSADKLPGLKARYLVDVGMQSYPSTSTQDLWHRDSVKADSG